MKKYFIKYVNGKIGCYSQEDLKARQLNKSECRDLVFEMEIQDIVKCETGSNDIYLTFEDDMFVIIMDADVILNFSIMSKIKNKIKKYIEKENLKKYKNSMSSNFMQKINRTKNFEQKLVATALSLAVALSMTTVSYFKNQKDNDMNNEIAYEQQMDLPQRNAIQATFYFEDKTETGQLERTINNCEEYLEKYIERYGLPRDIVYAMVATESGELECKEITNGSVGPMQINLEAHHREHYRVPCYENGVMSGYDDFWVCDANKLYDADERAFFKDKNVLYIQDLDNNFQIGCAYFRKCIDKYKNVFIAVDAYNKGINALTNAYGKRNMADPIEYYQENMNDFTWTYIVPHFNPIGNPNYLGDVLRYLKTDENGLAEIDYCYQWDKIHIDLVNEKVLIENQNESNQISR